VTTRIKCFLHLTTVMPFLIGQTSALAQQPVAPSPIGAADLFKKADGPSTEAPVVFAAPSPEFGDQMRRLTAIGHSHFKERRFAEAEVQYAASVSLAERTESHPYQPYFLVLALFYQANAVAYQSRTDEARGLIDRAVRECPDDGWFYLDQFDYMFKLATNIYRSSKKMSDLRPILRKFYSLEARIYGEGHSQVARHASEFGDYLIRQGKLEEAEEVFTGRFSLVEKYWGLEASELDEAADRLVRFYGEVAKEAEAERLLREILARREAQLGRNHEKVAESFVAYAKLLRESGRDAEADRCVARAFGIRFRNGLVAMIASRRAATSLKQLNRSGV
jgi:tetratricopeptide (TPR) repeat protein